MTDNGKHHDTDRDRDHDRLNDELRQMPPQSLEIDIPVWHLLKIGVSVVVIVLVVGAVERAQEVLGLALIAGVLASVLSPAIDAVQTVVRRRAIASVIVHLMTLIVVAVAIVVVINEVRSQADVLRTFTEQQLAESETASSVGSTTRVRLANSVSQAFERWGIVSVVGDSESSGIAVRLSNATIAIVLSIFFSLGNQRLVGALSKLTNDREQRRKFRGVWNAGVAAASGYLRRTLVSAILNAVAIAAVAMIFDLPAVLLVAAWGGLMAFVPFLGAPTGWLPVVMLAAFTSSPAVAIAVIAIAVAALIVIGFIRARIALPFDAGIVVPAAGIAAGLGAGGLVGALIGLYLAVGIERALAHHDLRSVAGEMISEPAFPADPGAVDSGELTEGRALAASMHGEQLRARFSQRTLTVVGLMVVFAVVIQLALRSVGFTLIWAVVGLLLAIGLDRPVVRIERATGLRRSLVVIIGGVLVLLVFGVVGWSARSGISSSMDVTDNVPRLVSSIESLPIVGDSLAERDLDREISRLQTRLQRLATGGPVAEQTAELVAAALGAVFWIAVIASGALLDGPRLVRGVQRRVPAVYVRQADRLGRAAQRAVAGYVAGSALVAFINGTLVGVIALLTDTPMPGVLAVWAFSWNFVPQIGAIIGWAPLVILALLGEPFIGIAVLVGFVLYQLIENNAIQPTIVGNAVDLSALAALGSALVGGAVAGLIGAVLAIPLVGIVKALRDEVMRDDFPKVRSLQRSRADR